MKKDITKRIDELLPFFMAGGAGAGAAKKGTVSGDIKKPMKGARLIVVGKRPKITGMSWHDIERAAHKKYFSITPKFIEDLIKKELL
jgi:ribosomal protein S10